MTEADYQLTVTTIGTVIVAVCGPVSIYLAGRAHAQGVVNAAKIDTVQGTVDGAAHQLASNLATSQAANEAALRDIASSVTNPKPPPP